MSDVLFESMTMVRHKKSKKTYAVVGKITKNMWDAVVYRCDKTGLMMNRDGTRVKITSLEAVPNAPVCRYI